MKNDKRIWIIIGVVIVLMVFSNQGGKEVKKEGGVCNDNPLSFYRDTTRGEFCVPYSSAVGETGKYLTGSGFCINNDLSPSNAIQMGASRGGLNIYSTLKIDNKQYLLYNENNECYSFFVDFNNDYSSMDWKTSSPSPCTQNKVYDTEDFFDCPPDCTSFKSTALTSITSWSSNPISSNKNNALGAINSWAGVC